MPSEPLSSKQRTERIERYRAHLTQANNESVRKELLKGLLHDLFGHDETARRVLDEMSLGAERTVVNIPLGTRSKTGFADTQYGHVIIEFEPDLKRKGEEARRQLQEYLAGNWKSGDTYRFTLIAADGMAWRIYAPRYEDLMDLPADARQIPLIETESFTLTADNGEAFYLFLDRFLFGQVPQKPTLRPIQQQFGEASRVFLTALGTLERHLDDVGSTPALKVAFEQWRRFLSIAYGSKFRDDTRVFLVHTYLSILAKVFAYEVLTGDEYISDDEMADVLSGRIFTQHNVENFVERDFFGWVAEPLHLKALRPALREIAREVARYDFSVVDEDILKGVYQELVDLETRHALGEYYTPDWLCERVLRALLPEIPSSGVSTHTHTHTHTTNIVPQARPNHLYRACSIQPAALARSFGQQSRVCARSGQT